jgi:hypothetical protein
MSFQKTFQFLYTTNMLKQNTIQIESEKNKMKPKCRFFYKFYFSYICIIFIENYALNEEKLKRKKNKINFETIFNLCETKTFQSGFIK